jgi:hypothetical protein
MLRIKMRNHIRRSSPDERHEWEQQLRDSAACADDAQRRQVYATLYEVYADEAARSGFRSIGITAVSSPAKAGDPVTPGANGVLGSPFSRGMTVES